MKYCTTIHYTGLTHDSNNIIVKTGVSEGPKLVDNVCFIGQPKLHYTVMVIIIYKITSQIGSTKQYKRN